MSRLLDTGFVEAVVADGRVPIGATEPCDGLLLGPPWRGGEPPGDEALVRLDCWAPDASNMPLLPGLD